MFYLNSVAFGVGLAMDAFSVSMANGLHEPKMSRRRICLIAGVFAAFQILMPIIGWWFVHTAAETFTSFSRFIPWIALALLLMIGGKMVYEATLGGGDEDDDSAAKSAVGAGGLMLQGVATSIDALSVGFTISELGARDAVVEALIIGAVTFCICVAGVLIGKKFGVRLGKRASLLGGVILIAIGIEIFVSGVM